MTETTPKIEKIADALAAHLAPSDESHFIFRNALRNDLIEFAKEIKLACLEGEFR